MDKNRYACLTKPPQSYWLTPSAQPSFEPLRQDIRTDVAIVGGGIAGLSTAWFLMREGVRPVVLEADRILFGTTGHTTAKITSQHGLIYDKLIRQMGKGLAQQYASANEQAIREITRVAAELNADCDLTGESACVYTAHEQYVRSIDDEVTAATSLGIAAGYVEKIPFGIPALAAVRFEGQARFHPRKYLLALVQDMAARGVAIHEHSRVVDLEDNGDGYVLTTGDGKRVRADRVVIASHYPFFNKAGLYFARIYVERSYIVAIRAREQYPGGMYINAEEPTRSLRCQPAEVGELTLVGGENHKTGQSPDTVEHYKALIDFAAEHFDVLDIPYRWSTQDCMTLDGVPYTGRFTSDTPNLYVTTGFGKWGMTNATASAMLLRDLITRGRGDWEDVYSPSRFDLGASAKNAVVENANVAANLIAGKLEPVPDEAGIKPGEGLAVEIEGHRAGAFRDREGHLHTVDTTCTHMGCEVNWNTAEHSWDCPCHGSRFGVDGEVIEGPALRDLNCGKSLNTIEKLVKDEY